MADGPKDEELRRTFSALGFIAKSAGITDLLRRAQKAACVNGLTILLEGETGTGKQVLARAIHELDQKRRSLPFITIHCGSVSEALAESELFGHQRGAFSGAFSNRPGLFRAAQHGTLFLDDVNDLPLQLQVKLLDALQRGAVRPLGSDREVPVDVRLIAASNQLLAPLVEQKRFRSDLYHRLNVVRLYLPPLRERAEDLPELLSVLARRHSAIYGPIEAVDPELIHFLGSKPFLGNIRELENAVKRMLFLKDEGASLGIKDWLAQSAQEEAGGLCDPLKEAAEALWKAICEQDLSYAQALQETERRVLQIALNGRVQRIQVAQRLKTSERTLYYKMRMHGLGSR